MTRPRLDSPTIVAYLQLSFVAFFLTGFGSTQALLRDEQSTSKVVSGMHAVIFALTGIFAALLMPRLVARFKRSRVLTLAAVAFSIGLGGYIAPVGPASTLPAIGLVAIGTTAMIICFSAFLMEHQGAAGPASLTQANALAAVASVIAPLAIGIGAAVVLGWRFSLWVILIALLVVILVTHSRTRVIFDATTGDKQRTLAWRDLPNSMWWSVLLVAVFSAIELTTFLWAADLLRERGGASPSLAASLVATIAIGLVIGRIVGTRLAQSRDIDVLLGTSGIVALAGFTITWFSQQTPVMALGFIIIGAGLSLNRPLGFARAVRAANGPATQATSLVSVAGGIAFAIFSLTLGVLAEGFSVHAAFLVLPGLLIAALVVLRFKPETHFLTSDGHD
jgi:predicted MFS family arabinose efflux permease